jgi:fucose 4-O-acetylase-like acetyltransferase
MKPAELLDRTPAHRDRVIDLIRAASLVAVILGHWLMASVTVTEAGIRAGNALADMSWLQPVTWLVQVMPLFFVAGGFANLTTWRSVQRRGGGYAGYVRGRVSRLAIPALVFVAVVPVLLVALALAGLSTSEAALAGGLLGQPLWFLAVYVLVTALAPAFAAWHARHPAATLGALALLAVGTDAVRLAWYEPAGYLNLGFVWLFAQQIGFWYADGRLARLPRGALVAMVGGSVGALLVLTGAGPYPLSMVGLPGEMSNMAPPTVCVLVLAVGQVAALMLVRPRLATWLQSPRPWLCVVTVGTMAMTLYLWHQLVLVAGFATLLWLDVPLPAPGTPVWWASRPVWCALLGAVLVLLARPLARFERMGGRPGARAGVRVAPAWESRPAAAGTFAAAAGVVMVAIGFAGLVRGGLLPSTSFALSAIALIGGLGLVRSRRPGSRAGQPA